MAIHFSTTAWKIPWTEKPGRLQSKGLQRVRHDWVTSLSPYEELYLLNYYITFHYVDISSSVKPVTYQWVFQLVPIFCYGKSWPHISNLCFPDSSVGKESACNAGDPGLIPGLGRCPGEGIGYLLQYSWAFLVAQLVKNQPAIGRPGFNPWVAKIPWRRERLPTPVFWPGEFQGLYSPWGHKRVGHDWATFTSVHMLTQILNMGKTELLGSRVLASWSFYNFERHCQRYHPFPFYRVTPIYAH